LLETALVAFATFFATIGPFNVPIVFASLTGDLTPKERMAAAVKGVVIASGILMAFAISGDFILNLFGITLPALRIAGGILLLLISIDMVFARSSGAVSTTPDEEKEAEEKSDISVFPLATPLLAGPGAMGAVVLLMADVSGDTLKSMVVVGALLSVLAMALVSMLLTAQLQRLLGKTGVHVISRIFGVILSALAVQFMVDGLAGSALFV